MVSPTQLVASCDDPAAEAEHWSIFADVFEQEVRGLATSSEIPLCDLSLLG